MNTQRAYRGSDTTLTLWIRDEAGKVDFADDDVLKLYLYPYGSSLKVEESGITGTFADATFGRVVFVVTEEYADTNLPRGSYRYTVKQDDAQVSDGLLEVV